MKKEIREKIEKILDNHNWRIKKEGWGCSCADQLLSLFEAEKKKSIEDYANDIIPKLNKKWRRYLEEEKKKWEKEKYPLYKLEGEKITKIGCENCEKLKQKYKAEKQKWVKQLQQGKICHNCGAEKESNLSDWCPKCVEEE